MPDFLSAWIKTLTKEQAEQLYNWVESNPTAAADMALAAAEILSGKAGKK